MRIGILVREIEKNSSQECFSTYLGVPKAFIDILRSFNVTPVLLTSGVGVDEIIDSTSGLIIPGSALPMSDLREFPVDKEIISNYLSKDKYCFGICGGMQELCTLRCGKVVENGAESHFDNQHTVCLDGEFEDIFGSVTIEVNSYHNNRCVLQYNTLNQARSNLNGDDICEGFIYNNMMGVQWHAEIMPSAHYNKLFKYFIGVVSKR